MAVKRSHNLSIGIVGLPNSGKSTIFNALTQAAVPAENYPFCTIDKNVGVVKIPEPRLDQLFEFYDSNKKVNSLMTFVDIAGLVKGASKGEGLGNKFLSHIRETDAIMYVLRAFKGDSISHVYERINPVDDLKIVRAELILKDMETVSNKLENLKSQAKSGGNDILNLQIDTLEKFLIAFDREETAYSVERSEEVDDFVREMWLLTDKPSMYVFNIKGGVEDPDLEIWEDQLKEIIPESESEFIIKVDCRTETDLIEMNDSDKKEFKEMISNYKGVDDIIANAFNRLNLLTFFTGNQKEVNAWTIEKGATVKEAAGVIHSDLEDNFVASEVINVEKMIKAGGWLQSKELGSVASHGRDYIIQDGDYVNILANR